MREAIRKSGLGLFVMGLFAMTFVATSEVEEPQTDDTDVDTDTGAPPPVRTSGDCEVDVSGLSTATSRTLTSTVNFISNMDLTEEPGFVLLEDQPALDTFADGFYLEVEGEIDFSTEVAIGLYAQTPATCGFRITEQGVYDNGGVPHLVFDAVDSSGACDYVCDAEGSAVWIVAVPRPEALTACVRHIPDCD